MVNAVMEYFSLHRRIEKKLLSTPLDSSRKLVKVSRRTKEKTKPGSISKVIESRISTE